ncbi:gustatory receptor for bitter taste 22e-like [Drosophila tropicalis]|uniref:gustatory receptor for bitter taste 22e-like n=1 Tax=Drosophila tropicalis TaxID=46794 RepID=UPI0035ABFD4C
MYRTDQRMFHYRQSFRQKFVHFIERITLWASWAMGLFPFTYNDASRKWIRSKWLIGYGLLLNSGLIWLVATSDSNTISPARMAVISLCLTGTTILLLSMQYHIAVATVYRLVWLINGKLLKLVNRLRSGQTVHSVEIDLLLFLYNRLLDINTRLAGIYDLQMTMVMVTFLTANIISIFFMIVYCITLRNTMSLPMYIVVGHAWVVNFWDFWLSIVICELAERTGKQTSVILKLFSDCDNIDTDLERSINDFAVYCTHSRLRFRHCGMFYVNKESGFHMIVTSILYLLWLVQFDFKNL